ncbi:glycyl-tRNA synthetase [Georgenia satyanarayanai]|uniref:Glycine--tRNA ligase n=1 Tax=Georgenia satyanarayanai TaxID=860221 RepID=A0A2Y8ZY25_9MICO|nr:glycyl-tRNA synthetase [Georgenia satyanarayanai]SSA36456.1 glycyl-tRNA synthetase [Georgenia satyanarayanai]
MPDGHHVRTAVRLSDARTSQVRVCHVRTSQVRTNDIGVIDVAAAPSRLDSVINLAKRRGFVFPSGEIYGGTRSAWDYGPLGVELKENIKRQWWRTVVQAREDVVGLDSSIILPRQVWVASGHVGVFTDPLTECLSCHKRFRADQMEEEFEEKKGRAPEGGLAEISCPNCGTRGEWTEPRDFNMMLKTYLGPVEDESGLHYLRPETAQGIFVNFGQVMTTSRKKPPFGIAQIGKSFRNEITPGNFIFRTREFEQMELEFFVEPGTDAEWHQRWIDARTEWYTNLGIKRENLRHYEHPQEKLSHYSTRTVDIEYRFGFSGSEWGELEGIANRTDFDLKTHTEHSGQDLSYFDQAKNERWVPYVIEPSAGLTRSLMAFLVEAYSEDEAPNAKGGVDKRTVLKLDPRLAPVKAAVLPLSRNEQLSPVARNLATELRQYWNVDFDDAGAVGRRYRRQDEIGTPLCVTVDFDTLEDQAVTIRDRDTMTQERVALSQVRSYLAERLVGA